MIVVINTDSSFLRLIGEGAMKMEKMTFNLYKYILFAMGFVIAQLTILIVTLIQQINLYLEHYSPEEIAEIVETFVKTYISPMVISVFVLLGISVVAYLIEFQITKAYRKRKQRKNEPLNKKYEMEKPELY